MLLSKWKLNCQVWNKLYGLNINGDKDDKKALPLVAKTVF